MQRLAETIDGYERTPLTEPVKRAQLAAHCRQAIAGLGLLGWPDARADDPRQAHNDD